MFVRLSAAIAAVSLLSSAALAQGAKPTDPQIAHIAYTAGVIDIAISDLVHCLSYVASAKQTGLK